MYGFRRIAKALFWLLAGDKLQKRRVKQELARITSSFFGDFPLSEDHKLWREDQSFLTNYKRLSPGNPYSQDRKYVLREFVRFTHATPGVMAECGCYQGASAFFIAQESPNTPLHLFDSFEGLSAPRKEDSTELKGAPYWVQGDLATHDKIVLKNLAEFDNIEVHKGWIPNRFQDVDNKTFRLVHIDVDLYQPTKDSLEFFYSRMNRGGVIVMDDYGSTLCPGARKAADEFFADKPEYLLHFPTGQGVIIIGCENAAE